MRFGQGYSRWTGGPERGERGSRSWGPFTVEWDMGGGDGGPRGGGPRGRGRRVFDGGELRLVLLKLAEDSPRHGYDLIRAVEERAGGAYAPSPGVVYPTLTLLQDMGFLDEQKAEGSRKLFAITEAGHAHLAEHSEEVEGLFERLESLGNHARRAETAPVRRALHNLRHVLQQKVGREEQSSELAFKIVELIDELAQKVERL